MGVRLRAGIPSRYVTSQLDQFNLAIPPGSLNRVPASAGGKGGNVTSAGWQVTLYDPIWQVSSSSYLSLLVIPSPLTPSFQA